MRTLIFPAITLLSAVLCLPIMADETDAKIATPGFRPESEIAQDFLESIKTATIRTYPTIVRTFTKTHYSTNSQKVIVGFINTKGLSKAVSDKNQIDPGELKGQAQYDMFQNDMKVIARILKSRTEEPEYHLVMECLIAPLRPEGYKIFGIHCYILDHQGRNAFSFLLNSHHQLFVDAAMQSAEESDATRNALVDQATLVGLEALVQQLQQATASKPVTAREEEPN